MEASNERRKVLEIKADLESIKAKVLKLDTTDGLGVTGTVIIIDSLIEDMDDALFSLNEFIKLNQE